MSQGTRVLLLFDNVNRHYVSRVTEGAIGAAKGTQFKIEAVNLFGREDELAPDLFTEGYQGVILTPPLSDDRRVLTILEQQRTPFVRIASMLDLDRGASVLIDELAASKMIAKLLIDAGHEKIAFIRGPREHLVNIRRYNGYAGALGGARLAPDPALVFKGDFSRASGRQAAEVLFKLHPTAIFASNDEMALGVMDYAKEVGVAIPDDVSVVGFDDDEEASRYVPSLTTVKQPLREMGASAVQLISEAKVGSNLNGRIVEVDFEVCSRDSVRTLG